MLTNAITETYRMGIHVVDFLSNYNTFYHTLETQVANMQMLQDAEDPPETLHLPWGIWLHKRDPLHSIHQRFDTEHLIRTGMVAEDILHYANYAPIIEGLDDEHTVESHGVVFEYDYSHDLGLYNAEINFEREIEESKNLEVTNAFATDTFAVASEEKPFDTETESNEAETSETLNVSDEKPQAKNNKIHKRDLNLGLEEKLTIIFEKFLMRAKILK